MIRIITFTNAGKPRTARPMLADARKRDTAAFPEGTLERRRGRRR
jgi:hypothetical protein